MPAEVNFSQPGQVGSLTATSQPSPSIWKDCPKGLLNDLGLGLFQDLSFAGFPTGTLAAALDVNMVAFGQALKVDADTDTVLADVSTARGGALQLQTDGDDNDAVALFSQPIGPIVRNSGNKLWFETEVAHVDVSEDYGVFVGLVEEDAIDGTTTTARDVLDDNVAANGLVAESVIGFIRDAGDLDAWDVVVTKDGGTAFNPLTDVTNATAIASGDRASLADNAYYKLGIKFDGRETIEFFVNGTLVGSDDVDGTYDQAHDYCVVIGLKTGTAAAEDFIVKRVRFAYQTRA